jgi:hypothetical protein
MNVSSKAIVAAILCAGVLVSWSVSGRSSRGDTGENKPANKAETKKNEAKKSEAKKADGKKKTEPVPPRLGTTVQLPTFGVAVDAEGLVTYVAMRDPDGRLARERLAAAKAAVPADLMSSSVSRKVSLNRLEAAIKTRIDEGKSPDEAMRNLAGLQRVESVFFYPERGEIVIAGPAEGWMDDAVGRVVGVSTGRPTLRLDDLLVALRAYPPDGPALPLVGCTILPPKNAWERFVAFQRTIPNVIPQAAREETAAKIAQGSREALGLAEIRVLGISDRAHMGAVMVECDYRMKLIAVGLEPPPVKLKTYLDLLNGAPKRQSAQRWWFTPDYECIRATDDGLAMQLVGDGVILREENQLVSRDGELTPDGTVDGAAQAFAAGFTRNYDAIATASPVFAELRNSIDLLVVAAYVRDRKFCVESGWDMALLLDEERLPTQTCITPREVESVVNVVWKGNRLLAPTGGVTIHPQEALKTDRLPDEGGKLARERDEVAKEFEASRWWWD